MTRRRIGRPGGVILWLLAGLAGVGAGAAAGLAGWLEAGVALSMAGAGACGVAAGLARTPGATREMVRAAERRFDAWQRAVQRQTAAVQRQAGVSPAEQVWLRLRPPAADGDPARAARSTLDETDRRLAELIRRRCDDVWRGIADRRYVIREHGRLTGLDGGVIVSEIADAAREVAALYHVDSDRAVAEARIGDIALAVRSTVGDLLQAVQQVPVVDVAGWSVRDVMTRLEQVQTVRSLYRQVEPYTLYARGAMLAARLALGANPVTLAAWYIGGEAATRVGGKVLAEYGNVWLKEMLESSVALVYLQAARIYDPRRVYRSVDWIACVEALRVHAAIPGRDHNRRLLLDRVLRAGIPDEFVKLALLRALAADTAPAAGAAAAGDRSRLDLPQRQAIAARLRGLLADLQGLREPPARAALDRIERTLGVPVAAAGDARPAAARVEAGFMHLAVLLRDRCGFDDAAAARRALDATRFAARARAAPGLAAAGPAALARAVTAVFEAAPVGGRAGDARGAPRPGRAEEDPGAGGARLLFPRELVQDPLAEPLLTTTIDLLAAHAPSDWPRTLDQHVRLGASVLLADRAREQAVWNRYLEAASARVRARVACADRSTWPRSAAPAILRAIAAGSDAAAGGYRPPPRPIAVFTAAIGMAGPAPPPEARRPGRMIHRIADQITDRLRGRLRAVVRRRRRRTPGTPAPAAVPAARSSAGAGRGPAGPDHASTGSGRAHQTGWLLLWTDRLVVGLAPEGAMAVDDGTPDTVATDDVRFSRASGVVMDDLVVRCGPRRLTVPGAITSSFEAAFGPVLARLGIDAARLPTES